MSKDTIQEKRFAFELEENAKDSLRHGIEHLLTDGSPADLKQAILSVFHAVELFLKSRLAKEHPTLIFKHPEEANSSDPHTVSFETVIKRLQAAGVTLDKIDCENLAHLQKVRNRLEHHRYDGDKQEAEDFVAKAANFLHRFIDREFDTDWKDILGRLTLETETLALSYEQRLRAAGSRLAAVTDSDPKSMGEDVEMCEACGEDMVPCPDPNSPDGTTECYFCGEEYFIADCNSCGCRVLTSSDFSEIGYTCGGCDDHYQSR